MGVYNQFLPLYFVHPSTLFAYGMKVPLLTMLLLSTGLAATAQWVNQPIAFANPAATATWLEAVDANTIWTATFPLVSNGTYLSPQVARSTDGGQNWVVRSLPLTAAAEEEVFSLNALSASTAWVLLNATEGSSGARLLRTTDGGQNWAPQGTGVLFTSPDSYAYHVHFFSATEGLVVGESLTSGGSFEMYRTTDGGQSWAAVSAPATLADENPIVLAPAIVGNSIWLGTDEGRVFRSTDRGQTWAVFTVTDRGELTQIIFRDQQNGLALSGDDGAINHLLLRTTDGGQTWSQVNYSGPLHGVSISAVPGTSQYVSVGGDYGNGDQGSSYSRDQGQTWIALENQLNHSVVDFVSPTVGWSSGFQGTEDSPRGNGLHKFGSTVLGLRGPDAALQAGLRVVPNPAEGGRSSLRAAQPFGATAQVRVLDVTGRLINTYNWTGNMPLELDLNREKAGLYVLEVAGANGTARQKLQVQ